MIYLDGSALCRFLPGVRHGDEWTDWVSTRLDQLATTQLGFTELRQAAELYPRSWQDDVEAIVKVVRETVTLLRLDEASVELSSHATTVLKPFAALHIGAAVSHEKIDAIATYDPTLAHVAEIYKLQVHSPGLEKNWHHKFEGPPEDWQQESLDAPYDPGAEFAVATEEPTAPTADEGAPGEADAGADVPAAGGEATAAVVAAGGVAAAGAAAATGSVDIPRGPTDDALGASDGTGAEPQGDAGAPKGEASGADATEADEEPPGPHDDGQDPDDPAAVADDDTVVPDARGAHAGPGESEVTAGAMGTLDGAMDGPTGDDTGPVRADSDAETELGRALREMEMATAGQPPGDEDEVYDAFVVADADVNSRFDEFEQAAADLASAQPETDEDATPPEPADSSGSGDGVDAHDGAGGSLEGEWEVGKPRSREEIIASIGEYAPKVEAWRDPESAPLGRAPGGMPGAPGAPETPPEPASPAAAEADAPVEAEAPAGTPAPPPPPPPADAPVEAEAPAETPADAPVEAEAPAGTPAPPPPPPPAAGQPAVTHGQMPPSFDPSFATSAPSKPPPPPPGMPLPAPGQDETAIPQPSPEAARFAPPVDQPSAPIVPPPPNASGMEPAIVHSVPPGEPSPEAKPLTVPIQWNIELDEPENYTPTTMRTQEPSTLPRTDAASPVPTAVPATTEPAAPAGAPSPPQGEGEAPGDQAAEGPARKGLFGRKKDTKKGAKKPAAPESGPPEPPAPPPAGGPAPESGADWKLDDVFGSDKD